MKRQRVMAIPETEFRSIVARHLSITAIVREVGFDNHEETYTAVRDRISDLGLDVSHFRPGGRRPRRYTDSQLRNAVADSRSIRQTLIRLGVRAEGGNYKTIQREIERLGLDTSHFVGKGWRKGDSRPALSPRRLADMLVEHSPVDTTTVRKRLLREGLKEQRCEACGLTEWRGRPVPLELDHINGIHDDHRLQNLRLLCPNCHALTATYRGRNKRRRACKRPAQLSML